MNGRVGSKTNGCSSDYVHILGLSRLLICKKTYRWVLASEKEGPEDAGWGPSSSRASRSLAETPNLDTVFGQAAPCLELSEAP